MIFNKLYIVFSILFCTSVFGQKVVNAEPLDYKEDQEKNKIDKVSDKSKLNEDISEQRIYVEVEQKACYPGTEKEFRDEFLARFRFPDNDWDAWKYPVMLMFIVDEDGALTDIKVARDPGYGLGREAIRVLKSLGKWTPAFLHGTAVRSKVVLSVPYRTDSKVELKLM